MYSESRNWKWMVPGMLFPLLLLFTRAFFSSPHEWVRWVGVVPGFAALVCAVAAVSNFFIYLRDQNVSFIERRYSVMNLTYTAMELKAAQGVHPDVAKMILGERDRLWMLKGGDAAVGISPHNVLFDAPTVTDSFFIYFLENSSDQKVMAMHGKLVEGRKAMFDPHGKVDEYTMYRGTISVLARKRMIVQYSAFSPWEWVQPWGPALTAANWGFELDETSTPSVVPTSPPNSKSTNLGEKEPMREEKSVMVEPELSDEELEAIRALSLEHTQKYRMSKEVYDSLPKDASGHAVLVK